MGFSLYVCEKCGIVACESDLGDHGEKVKCPAEHDVKESKRKRRLLKKYWGDSSVRMIFLSYWDSFWNVVDSLLDNEYDGDDADKLHKIKFVNSFMYGGDLDAPKYEIDDLERTKRDIKKTPFLLKHGMYNHMRRQQEEKGFYQGLKIPVTSL